MGLESLPCIQFIDILKKTEPLVEPSYAPAVDRFLKTWCVLHGMRVKRSGKGFSGRSRSRQLAGPMTAMRFDVAKKDIAECKAIGTNQDHRRMIIRSPAAAPIVLQGFHPPAIGQTSRSCIRIEPISRTPWETPQFHVRQVFH